MAISRGTLGLLVALLIVGSGTVRAQEVDIGGRAYVDYFYNFAAPTGEAEGLHGFRYRRLYLTTDFALSDDFTGRARLEADDESDGVPFVKNLSLTWAYSGEHSATIGVTSPPAFGLSEDVWGFRSLEKTIMDLQNVVESRDFGLRFDGPLTGDGTVRYAVMVANNNGVLAETNEYKRVYGQLQVRPSDRLLLVLGTDYAGYGGPREHATRVSAFGGYTAEDFRIGLDTYWYQVALTGGETLTNVGASLFGVLQVAPRWGVVARLDQVREVVPGPNRSETLVLGGVEFRPHPNVSLIPNLRVFDQGDAEAASTGRFTVKVQF